MQGSAGIVLAGGRSTRMGTPKAALPWHGSTLLARVCGLVGRAVDGPVVVVRAPRQPLPLLPPGVEVVDDPVEGRGPLQGIASGLAALADVAAVAYVSSTDAPLLHPAFVRRILAALEEEDDVVLPVVDGHHQPLAAAYRSALAPLVEQLLADGLRGPAELYARCRVRRLDEHELLRDATLACVDAGLRSLRNLNDPAAYAEALAAPLPRVRVEADGVLREVAAAHLGGAARAAGLDLAARRAVAVDGGSVRADPAVPLVDGDRVVFGPATRPGGARS